MVTSCNCTCWHGLCSHDLVGVLMMIDADDPLGGSAHSVVGLVGKTDKHEIQRVGSCFGGVVASRLRQARGGRCVSHHDIGIQADIIDSPSSSASAFLNFPEEVRR